MRSLHQLPRGPWALALLFLLAQPAPSLSQSPSRPIPSVESPAKASTPVQPGEPVQAEPIKPVKVPAAQPRKFTLRPSISSVAPSPCVPSGSDITLKGKGFGKGSNGLSLVVAPDKGSAFNVRHSSWSENSIVFAFPALNAGTHAFVGLQGAAGDWVAKSELSICADRAGTAQSLKKGVALPVTKGSDASSLKTRMDTKPTTRMLTKPKSQGIWGTDGAGKGPDAAAAPAAGAMKVAVPRQGVKPLALEEAGKGGFGSSVKRGPAPAAKTPGKDTGDGGIGYAVVPAGKKTLRVASVRTIPADARINHTSPKVKLIPSVQEVAAELKVGNMPFTGENAVVTVPCPVDINLRGTVKGHGPDYFDWMWNAGITPRGGGGEMPAGTMSEWNEPLPAGGSAVVEHSLGEYTRWHGSIDGWAELAITHPVQMVSNRLRFTVLCEESGPAVPERSVRGGRPGAPDGFVLRYRISPEQAASMRTGRMRMPVELLDPLEEFRGMEGREGASPDKPGLAPIEGDIDPSQDQGPKASDCPPGEPDCPDLPFGPEDSGDTDPPEWVVEAETDCPPGVAECTARIIVYPLGDPPPDGDEGGSPEEVCPTITGPIDFGCGVIASLSEHDPLGDPAAQDDGEDGECTDADGDGECDPPEEECKDEDDDGECDEPDGECTDADGDGECDEPADDEGSGKEGDDSASGDDDDLPLCSENSEGSCKTCFSDGVCVEHSCEDWGTGRDCGGEDKWEVSWEEDTESARTERPYGWGDANQEVHRESGEDCTSIGSGQYEDGTYYVEFKCK